MSIIDLKVLKKIPFRYELKPYGNIILTYNLNYILMRSNVAVINTFQNGHHNAKQNNLSKVVVIWKVQKTIC